MGGSSVCDGTLSLDEFNASARALVTKWRGIDVDALPDWEWRPCRKMGVPSETEGFVALEGVYRTRAGGQIEESSDDSVPDDAVEHDTSVQSSRDNVHLYDFHIVYSFSYKVPVLYFQGLQAGMHISEHYCGYLLPLFSFLIANICNLSLGGQLLTLDEIKKDLPPHSLQLLNKSKWTFITREEHPHLSRPWFTLHPCGTSDWMKLLLHKLGDKDRSLQYLPAWLSVAGQAVGLKIPLKLYCSS
uniref:Ubiquitin-like-conjugating enzyme ATG10 n=1 Tax=Triticum urartu TaxID=4572 RepID=A0A8R7PHK9_TRIUA